jgi:hypothetical protein
MDMAARNSNGVKILSRTSAREALLPLALATHAVSPVNTHTGSRVTNVADVSALRSVNVFPATGIFLHSDFARSVDETELRSAEPSRFAVAGAHNAGERLQRHSPRQAVESEGPPASKDERQRMHFPWRSHPKHVTY